jgi:hypothetical protein
MLEVCWDRHVIVHNQPDAIDSSEARCPTHPQVGAVTASQRAGHVVETMNEGNFAVRRDVQVAYLIGDGAVWVATNSCQARRLLSVPAYRRGGLRSNETILGA